MPKTATRLPKFEFEVWRRLAPHVRPGERWIVACSSGRDSVVLAHCLRLVADRLGLGLALVYVHHGISKDRNLAAYRTRARAFVRRLASELGVEFHSVRASSRKGELNSEAAMRDFRLASLESLRAERGFDRVAFAHHGDDLFETRLIRLIRGTGPQGMRAMRALEAHRVRPLLHLDADEVAAYAEKRKLTWCEDPSNAETKALRNWLRGEWLPALEKKRSGSIRAMARSLEIIAAACEGTVEVIEGISEDRGHGATFPRQSYLELGIAERRGVLAKLLRKQGARSFTLQHIEEIRKRIESPRGRARFSLLDLKWEVNAEQILVYPSDVEFRPSSLGT